jgi:hypothetical protein
MRRKDPNKTATKKWREQITRKDPNKTATKNGNKKRQQKTAGADDEEGPK